MKQIQYDYIGHIDVFLDQSISILTNQNYSHSQTQSYSISNPIILSLKPKTQDVYSSLYVFYLLVSCIGLKRLSD